jgi:hypothetical protein
MFSTARLRRARNEPDVDEELALQTCRAAVIRELSKRRLSHLVERELRECGVEALQRFLF